jgi:hypothetical protein
MRTRSLMAITQLPHVEFDIACDTEVDLVIPWTSPTSSMLLYDGQTYEEGAGDLTFGKVVIYPYSPLVSNEGGAQETCQVTVYLSLENVSLFGTGWSGQSGLGRPISEKEESSNATKPVSQGLMQLSKAASSFSNIPLLRPLMSPASWFLSAASGAASAFGFSKPNATIAPHRSTVLQLPNLSNADGTDTCDSLALYCTNSITPPLGFSGKDIDEMSIKYIASIPTYYTTLTWNALGGSNAAPGSLLAQWKLQPNTFETTVDTSGYTYYDSVPICYLTYFFRYWRGDIGMKLKFVKTQFHSGRLEILYNPFYTASTDENYKAQVHRDIIDIRECNEYTLVFPFASNLQMRDCWTEYESSDQQADAPVVQIFVTNPLVAPATAPQSISIIVEVFGIDWEVAAPGNKFSSLATPSTQPVPMPFILTSWYGQSGMPETVLDPSACSIVPPKYIGAAERVHNSLDYTQYSTGEAVLSILPLLKRYTEVFSTANGYFGKSLLWQLYHVTFINETETNMSAIKYSTVVGVGDYYSYFAPMFAYSVGSLRAIGMINNGDSSTNKGYVETSYYNIGYANVTSANGSGDTFISKTNLPSDEYHALPCQAIAIRNQPGSNPVACVQAPPYLLGASRLHRAYSNTRTTKGDRFSTNVAVRFRISNKNQSESQTTAALRLFRAAADDFRFGLFLGTPPVGWSKAVSP